jgi:hypothetical protein
MMSRWAPGALPFLKMRQAQPAGSCLKNSFYGNDRQCGRRCPGRPISTSHLQLCTIKQQFSHILSPPYTTAIQIMPVVEASAASSKTIAALFSIPVVILFLSIWVAVSCSERWNRSDHRFKKYLERKKRASSSSEPFVDGEAQT